MATNEELVAQAQRGDEAAYTELYRRNEGLRTMLAVRHGRRWIHDERMAEVDYAFVQAVKGFRQSERTFGCYLGVVVANRFANVWTKSKAVKRTAIVRSLDARNARDRSMHDTLGKLDDVLARAAHREAVAEARRRLDRLPARYREIVLRHCAGESLDEIGTSQGVTREAVRKIEIQAMEWLRMSDEEFEAERAVRRSLGGSPNSKKREAVTV